MEYKVCHIYGLVDPRTDELRYVGKTVQTIEKRYNRHVRDTKRMSWKNNWIKSLQTVGLQPEMFLIEDVSIDRWAEAETFWISYFKFIGCNLTNITSGGQGAHGTHVSESNREAMRNRMLGKKMPPESIEKMRRSKTGMKQSAEVIRRQSESRRGQKRSDDTRRKMSKSRTGWKYSEETKRKISETIKRQWESVPADKRAKSEETRRKLSESHKGIRMSEETKRKQSEIQSKIDRSAPRSAEIRLKISEGLRRSWAERKNAKKD